MGTDMSNPKTRKPSMRFCFNCGDELGRYSDHDQLDHCGKVECQRSARDAAAEQRDQAHENLDRQNGWGDYYGRY